MPQDFTLRQRRIIASMPQPEVPRAPGESESATDTYTRAQLQAAIAPLMSPAMRRAMREQLPSPHAIARERLGARATRNLSRGFMVLGAGFATIAGRATCRAADATPIEQMKQSAIGMGALVAGGAALLAATRLEDDANARLDAIDAAETVRTMVDVVDALDANSMPQQLPAARPHVPRVAEPADSQH